MSICNKYKGTNVKNSFLYYYCHITDLYSHWCLCFENEVCLRCPRCCRCRRLFFCIFSSCDDEVDDEVIFLCSDETVVARRPFIWGPSHPSETDVALTALRGAYIKCPSIRNSRRWGSGISAAVGCLAATLQDETIHCVASPLRH